MPFIKQDTVDEVRVALRSVMLSNHTGDFVVETMTPKQAEFLLKVIDCELAFRAENKRRRLIRRARFPMLKTTADYVWDNVELPSSLSREDLVSLEFIAAMRNLVLLGAVGTGKTHLAIALGLGACEAGLRVRFTTTSEMVLRLTEARDAGTLEKAFKEYTNLDLLILDEWGYVPIDRDGARLLFQIISQSYEHHSLILTTNLEFSKWGSVLTDDQMAAAMIDRIAHHGHLLVFKGESWRMKNALMRH